MTKKTKQPAHENNGACLTSRLALSAAVVAMPLMLAATPAMAAETTHLFLKAHDSPGVAVKPSAAVDFFIKIEGLANADYKGHKWPGSVTGADDKGHTIYKNQRGEHFYIDPTTGDKKYLSNDQYIKIEFPGKRSIVGLDQQGNVLRQNEKGETFYLEPSTGDMIFVKNFDKKSLNPDVSGNEIIDAEDAVMQLEVNINQLALLTGSSISDQASGGSIASALSGAKSGLDLARHAFADKNYGKAADLAQSAQTEAQSATKGIDVLAWSWGTAKRPQTPAPTDKNPEQRERRDAAIPEVEIDIPAPTEAPGGP